MDSEDFAGRNVSLQGLFTFKEYEDVSLALVSKKYEPKIFKRHAQLIPA